MYKELCLKLLSFFLFLFTRPLDVYIYNSPFKCGKQYKRESSRSLKVKRKDYKSYNQMRETL